MKENSAGFTRGINIVCAILMLALLVCQFVPFWSLDGETSSIGGYVWFPDDHTNFTAYFQEKLNDSDFYSGSIAGINVVIILACAVGFILCLRYSNKIWPNIISAACGIVGMLSYIAYPIFRMGSLWELHIALCVGMLILAIISFAYWLKSKKA